MNGNPSRDNGSALCDGEQVAFKRGMVTVDVCGPNTWTRAQCQQFDSQTSLATDSTTVFELGSEEEIWSAAALGAVIVVAVQVPNGTGFSSYNSGICPAFHGSGNHAIEVIDIEMYNGTLVYVVKNHWGLSWGLDGFGLMTFDSFAETINNHQFWAAFATQETGS